MSEPSLTESFVAVACCGEDTARGYLQRSAGDMMQALAKYFQDQERQWDVPRRAPQGAAEAESTGPPTQPVEDAAEEGADAAKGAKVPDDCPPPRPQTNGCGAKADPQGHQLGKKHKRPDGDDAKEGAADAEYDHLDPSLPWNKVRFGALGEAVGEGRDFVFDSIKSKVQSTNFQGPQEGSTWHWFMVGDQKVYPDDDESPVPPANPNASATTFSAASQPAKAVMKATTYINGDKFQAGWSRDPSEKMGEKVMANRKGSMLESILEQKVNAYGKHRGGCRPGYSHRWTYADAEWAAPSTLDKASSVQTSECFWDEQKNADRWLVNIHMKWTAHSASILPGVYVIVADQVATKLNKNQYRTAMKGRRWRIGAVDDAPEALAAAKHRVLAACLAQLKASPVGGPSKPGKQVSPHKKQKVGGTPKASPGSSTPALAKPAKLSPNKKAKVGAPKPF